MKLTVKLFLLFLAISIIPLALLFVLYYFSEQLLIRYELFKNPLLVFFILIAIVTTLAGWWLARRFVNPVQKLVKGAENICQGNFSQELDTQSNNEIGILSRTLDLMSLRLNQSQVTRNELAGEVKERLRAEDALRILYMRHEATLAAVPDIIMVVDKNKIYNWANKAGYDFFGPDVIGKEAAYYFEGQQDTYNVVQSLFTGSEEVIYVESRQKRQDGQFRLLGWRCRVLKDKTGQVVGVLSSAQDITEHNKTEIALKKSEDKFSRAFQRVPLILGISTLQEGRFLEVNDAFYRILGFNKAEVIGRTSLELGVWQIASDRLKIKNSLEKNIPIRDLEVGLFTKHGKPILAKMSVESIEIDSEPCLMVICEDITERKKIEDSLKKSEQEYSSLAKNLPVIVYRIHLGDDHRTEFFNDMLFKISGYQPDDLFLGEISSLDPLMIPLDRLRYVQVVKHSIANQKAYTIDYHIKNKKGELLQFAERGNPVVGANQQVEYIDGIISDITERKRGEEALQESEQRYRSLVETMAQGVVYLDSSDHVVFANPAALHILGTTFAELQLKLSSQGIPAIKEDGTDFGPDEHPSIIALKTGQPVSNVIMGIYNTGKQARSWIVVDAVPQFHPGGKIPYQVYFTFSDITERIMAEEQKLEIETLKRLNQAKSELLSNVSHELRTPLASIKGFIETLIEPDVKWSKSKQLEFLTEADQQTDILTHLVQELLDMSRLDSGKYHIEKRDCTIDELLKDARSRLTASLKNHVLKTEIADGLPVFKADKNRLVQVLVNLIENASKFSKEGSEILFKAKVEEDKLVMSVADQGIGMDAETLRKVFDRFFQAGQVVAGKTRGTGLGLAICKAIIEAHGGKIWVESQPGQGSTFFYTIPI